MLRGTGVNSFGVSAESRCEFLVEPVLPTSDSKIKWRKDDGWGIQQT